MSKNKYHVMFYKKTVSVKIKKTTRIKKLEWIVIYLIRRLIGFLFDWWDYFFLQHWSFLLWSVIYLFLEANCCFWLDLWITFLALTEEEEEIEMLLENYLQRYSYHFQQTLCFLVLNLFLAGSHYHFIVHSFRCESCHGQAERLLDSAREMEDSIAVNLRSVHCHQLSSRDAACSLFR